MAKKTLDLAELDIYSPLIKWFQAYFIIISVITDIFDIIAH